MVVVKRGWSRVSSQCARVNHTFVTKQRAATLNPKNATEQVKHNERCGIRNRSYGITHIVYIMMG